jgi:hypothetical protein
VGARLEEGAGVSGVGTSVGTVLGAGLSLGETETDGAVLGAVLLVGAMVGVYEGTAERTPLPFPLPFPLPLVRPGRSGWTCRFPFAARTRPFPGDPFFFWCDLCPFFIFFRFGFL